MSTGDDDTVEMNSDEHFVETFHDGDERKCFVTVPQSMAMASLGKPMDQNWVMTDAEMLDVIRSRPPRQNDFPVEWMQKTNQKSAGSCQCWTTAEIMSINHFYRTGELIIFDGAYLYSLLNNGVDHGSAVCDGLTKAGEVGDITVDDNPNPLNIWRSGTRKFDALAGKYKLFTDTAVQLASAREIKSYLLRLQSGAVNLVVMCDNGSRFASYKSGIVPVTHGIGNHSITGFDVVEYQGKPFIQGKNHWSPSWGNGGYGIIDDSALTQTIPVHGSWGCSMSVEEAL